MQNTKRALVALVLASAAVTTKAQSPIQKVLELLGNLENKITTEGVEAKKTFEEFSEWCKDRSANVGFEIKTGKSQVEELSAAIEGATAAATASSAEIERLASSIATSEADLKAATEIRTKEAADFAAEDKEMMETSSMLERAIGILERELAKGSASMVQMKNSGNLAQALTALVNAAVLNSQDASKLSALAQTSSANSDTDSDEDSSDDVGAPDAAAYKGHSGDIVSTLEDLLDKAKDMLEESRKKETSAKHNFSLLKQSLEDEMKFGTKDKSEATKNLAASKQAKASAEGDLSVTSKALKEDEETLVTVKRDCVTSAQDYEAATASRTEELKALSEAKKAIAENTAAADSLAYGSSASFLQVNSRGGHSTKLRSRTDLAHFEAVRIVRDLGRKQHSQALTQLAVRMATAASGADPFAKVKGLIMDMLDKLQADAQSEATHKAYCDEQLGETLTKKEEKEALIDKLTTKVDSAEARSAQLKDEVASLQKALAELAKSQLEMNKIRSDEKSTFETNKVDSEQGLEGIKVALKILRDYYAKDDAAHDAAEGSATGIIGMLEVVESDLSKGLAEMSVAEGVAADEYKRQTQANEISKTTKTQDVTYKTKEATHLDQTLAETKSDRSGAQAELDATLEYNSKLIAMCTNKVDTYEERTGRREAELAGLKEALATLEGESAFMQKGSILRRLRARK